MVLTQLSWLTGDCVCVGNPESCLSATRLVLHSRMTAFVRDNTVVDGGITMVPSSVLAANV
jgi:hypothetical protein